MSLNMGPSDEAAAQVFAGLGYSEVEILARRPGMIGYQGVWIITAAARRQDDQPCEVEAPMTEHFGGWSAVENEVRTREIN